MSLIAGKSLYSIVENGFLTANPANVNAASIDICLGEEIMVEALPEMEGTNGVVDLSLKQFPSMTKIKMGEDGYLLRPGEFILANSVEMFNLPDNLSGQFILRSSIARAGLNHLMAGFADAGFNNSTLTFELHNVTQYHHLLIKPGLRVGQILFFDHEPSGDNSYAIRGNYNGCESVTGAFQGEGHASA